MEVNEAIEFIEDSYTYLYVDLHGNKEEVKKFGEIVDLLKSLEAENKGYETVYKRALLENERLKMKIIKVSNCIECPFSVMKEPYDLQSRLPDFVCRNAHKKIYDIDSLKIPEWCPLEDIKEVIAND